MGHTQPTQNNNSRPCALVCAKIHFFLLFGHGHGHGHVRVYARLRHIKCTCTVQSYHLTSLAWPRWLGCSIVRQVGPWGACRWRSGPIYHQKVDQNGHGQHGHVRILINDAANCKIRLPVCDFFLKVTKQITHRKSDFAISGVVD